MTRSTPAAKAAVSRPRAAESIGAAGSAVSTSAVTAPLAYVAGRSGVRSGAAAARSGRSWASVGAVDVERAKDPMVAGVETEVRFAVASKPVPLPGAHRQHTPEGEQRHGAHDDERDHRLGAAATGRRQHH